MVMGELSMSWVSEIDIDCDPNCILVDNETGLVISNNEPQMDLILVGRSEKYINKLMLIGLTLKNAHDLRNKLNQAIERMQKTEVRVAGISPVLMWGVDRNDDTTT